MTDADFQRAIIDEQNDGQRCVLIHAYYKDMDRANRTSRAAIYIHLGLLVGMLANAANQSADQEQEIKDLTRHLRTARADKRQAEDERDKVIAELGALHARFDRQ